MSVIILLIAVSLTLALGFLAAFVWAVRHGQYEDTCTPAMRILSDDQNPGKTPSPSQPSNQAKP
ncbi:MAG TPA: cbb3-type cytochrome oxidase assembly protein CcoS [Verrucomicrobiota bacterium]|jgi:cbb3-type cytochrome oxidase maturation protein|nr:cbb3-type cytochrome oxidase assembly protein CcoS [Verrucomicrobiota bacterium]HRT08110.1 cbb3-type cytochrome oxidase assembly protein CcoS [Candidatus Paceibacterota bacterium]HRT58309.1 cbb3-type cytochrome oxidase assembly protein CcoS [Candidatus Paceibacterota bacterium]